MRLAVSNIAWEVADDPAVATLLRRYDVDAIDIAPGKYFEKPAEATRDEIRRVRDWWSGHGIEITGMQALLFGADGLNLFGTSKAQDSMLDRLAAVCRIGGELGATRLVFGSPGNRDRRGLSDAEAGDRGAAFFRRLGDIASMQGVMICLEPNPSCYGANFMTTSSETADVVRRVDHPAIRMQLDTGAMTLNGERPDRMLAEYGDLIGHIHVSEPNLIPLGEGETDHQAIAETLRQNLPGQIVCIEMRASAGDRLPPIEQALRVCDATYRKPSVGVAV